MAIEYDVNTRQRKTIIESTSVVGQPGTVVLNPDGTAISGAGSAGEPIAASPTASGYSTYRNPALTNTPVAIKATAGNLYWVNVQNPNTTDAWVHFYDLAQGSVVVGTTTPKISLWVPAKGGADVPSSSVPMGYTTAITASCSTTPTGGVAPTVALIFNAGWL